MFLFSEKSCRLGSNLLKYGKAPQTTDNNIIWRTPFAFWITWD